MADAITTVQQVDGDRRRQRRDETPPDPHLYRIRDLINHAAGIYQPDNKLYFLENRCWRRMQEVGIGAMGEYHELLSSASRGREELRLLLNEVTVGETSFFRYKEQLEALRRKALPLLAEEKSRQAVKHFRLWSAGCSTGEEAYTLAMLMQEEVGSTLPGWTFEVVGTDLNERSLSHAQGGVYGQYATRNVPEYFREKYFRQAGEWLQVNDSLKALVNFKRLNLRDDSQMLFLKSVDIIFCCNVLIYFDSLSRRHVIQHFYNNLMPKGYLFLGSAESLFGVNDDFQLVLFPKSSAYVKDGSKTASSPRQRL